MKETKKTNMFEEPKAEVATRGSTAVATPEQLEHLGFDLNENMDGVEPRLPQIGIAHQAQIFKMPDESKVSEIEGIIVDSNRVNAWWEHSFAEQGGGNPPDCFSFDGIMPQSDRQCSPDCAHCKLNHYGSDGGRGKLCKNMRRVHILLKGNAIPYRLTLPPTSLRNYDAYMVQLADKKRPYPTVVTKIALVKQKNKDGIEFSQATFEKAGEINDMDVLKDIADLRRKMKETMAQQTVVAAESQAAEAEADPLKKNKGDVF